MKISIITLFPNMVQSFLQESIVRRAQEKHAVEIEVVDMRSFGDGNYKTVDDKPYGGGAGMVLMMEPVMKALRTVVPDTHPKGTRVLLTSAQGSVYTQEHAQALSRLDHVVIIAGHYEGFDERILKYVDEEVSIGNFVMTGGEIAAAAITDSIVRLLPSVLKKEEATAEETFFMVPVATLAKLLPGDSLLQKLKEKGVSEVQLVEYPHYTRPEEYEGERVPEVLMSGHHKNITEWRLVQAYLRTKAKRPDLITAS